MENKKQEIRRRDYQQWRNYSQTWNETLQNENVSTIFAWKATDLK